ncbi:MAG: hypothetical protein L6R35_001466 [Caloplaca aegaea]|nr:MAG: hypothetical protein L6R35_001466 [Caloplaca aegaea]
MVLEAIKYSHGHLEILDQLRLPHEEIYVEIKDCKDAWHAVQRMQVRGAPAIALVAALSVVAEAVICVLGSDKAIASRAFPQTASAQETASEICRQLDYLVTSRPTAVNLADAATKLKVIVDAAAADGSRSDVLGEYIEAAEQMLIDDVKDNEAIGKHGAAWILKHHPCNPSDNNKVSVITHCNTGSLATAGYGTALGIIRSLHASKSLRQVFYTETRPYNQGSRLTGYELIHDSIPCTLITDSMAAALMSTKKNSENIAAVIVGADRVATNGDTANKIGTYALAVLARYHGVKFLVAAPRTTVDMETKSGADIRIEERPQIEVLTIKGPRVAPQHDNGSREQELGQGSLEEVYVAARGTHAWNPAFDVTPAELIDAIVTEKGVVEKDARGVFQWERVFRAGAAMKNAPEPGVAKPLDMLPDGITALEPNK